MPELPEVETVRRGLVPWMAGRVIEHASIFDARLVQPFDLHGVEETLTGRRIERLERRGKYLLLVLDDDLGALHHLRMTGSFVAGDALAHNPTHVRMQYDMGAGVNGEPAATVLYRDPRRFGTLLVAPLGDLRAYLDERLGPEPLGPDFTPAALRAALATRTCAIKAALLNQKIVAGLGNIYVDEACFLAGVRPDACAQDVGPAVLERLVVAIRERLVEAIDAGGSTLRDYRGVEGNAGGMQERFVAYGRAGRPCLTCGTTMRGTRIAGRGTTYCPSCQRLPRRIGR